MIVISMWGVLTRKKKYAATINENTQLARVLSTVDLTALGIGSTLGVGVYVIAGQVARETAGPAVVVSFLIAAVASILSGLCYAEFGARIPRAGSAYVYSYVAVGELVAFIIGWNLILEYVIGAASVAKGISLYIDSLADNILKETFVDVAPIDVSMMAEYFDFFAFGLAILLSVALAFGLKESTWLNNIATALSLCVVLFIIIAGAIKSDVKNWSVPANETVPEIGKGGFLPFGVSGMLKGAATCFYAFVGFDCIATTGEEVKNPKRAIPFAIIGSQIIIFIAYFCTSTVLTLMVPYYEQDVHAPFPHAFDKWENVKWIVAIGAICGLFTSLFGALLPLPRILYALASDGLIFKFLGKINATFSTPMIGTLIAGLITGLMAALFDLSQLVNMMSIGTLLAYTIVSSCVLILRYRDAYYYDNELSSSTRNSKSSSRFGKNGKRSFANRISAVFGSIFNTYGYKEPTRQSQRISLVYILAYSVLAFFMALLLFLLYSHLAEGKVYMIVLISVIGGFMILFLILLSFQPTSGETLSFKVPFVPIIPAFSILINIYLMLMLDAQTWIRFGIWMFIGIAMYLFCVKGSFKKTPKHLSQPPTPLPTQRTITNGHANPVFVVDEDSTCPSEEKPPSEDSGIERSVENIQAPIYDSTDVRKEDERVVKARNSITSIEDALATLDEAIPYVDDDDTIRRISIGNISNASSAKLVKEDVVALVHREDIRSIPTTPVVEIPPSDDMIKEIDVHQSDDEDVHDITEDATNHHIQQDQSPCSSLILSDDVGVEETDTDILENEVFSIPPAPPLIDFETYKVPLIPRVSITRQEKPVPPPPPPPMDGFKIYKPTKITNSAPPTPLTDYSREPSISRKDSTDESDTESLEDNVKVGDKHYEMIKNRLTKLFTNNIVTKVPQTKLTKVKDYPVDEAVNDSKSLKPVMSRVISEINRTSSFTKKEIDDGPSGGDVDGGKEEKLVDETPQTQGDIRNRLDALFKSTRVNPMSSSPNKSRKVLNRVANYEEANNNANDLESHRMQMLGTLKSIKLRSINRNT